MERYDPTMEDSFRKQCEIAGLYSLIVKREKSQKKKKGKAKPTQENQDPTNTSVISSSPFKSTSMLSCCFPFSGHKRSSSYYDPFHYGRICTEEPECVISRKSNPDVMM